MTGPAALVLTGIVSVQLGAGLAIRLFHQLAPATVTGLRLWSAAIILLIVGGRGAKAAGTGVAARRAWRDAVTTVAFGVCLGVMNYVFYQAIARVPLGVAVTIEFLGPLAVAVAGSRRPVDLLWVALAAAGVVLLTGTGTAHLNAAGIIFAALSAAGWAGYIVLSAATGRRFPGSSGLVIAMLVAAVVVTPTAGRGDRALAAAAVRPGHRGQRRGAVLGDPVRGRAAGAAAAADEGVRHLDEPGAGRGGADRPGPARPAPVGQRMGRRRLRRGRLRRRRPLRSPRPGSPGPDLPGPAPDLPGPASMPVSSGLSAPDARSRLRPSPRAGGR